MKFSIYSNMQTMRTEDGLIIAEILWNHNKECFTIRNHLTNRTFNYETRDDMKKAWAELREFATKIFLGVEVF